MAYDVRHANGPSTRGSTKLKMPWNNNGPSPWGNQGGGGSGGGQGSGGGGGDGDGGQPPHGPWGGGGDGSGGDRGGRPAAARVAAARSVPMAHFRTSKA